MFSEAYLREILLILLILLNSPDSPSEFDNFHFWPGLPQGDSPEAAGAALKTLY